MTEDLPFSHWFYHHFFQKTMALKPFFGVRNFLLAPPKKAAVDVGINDAKTFNRGVETQENDANAKRRFPLENWNIENNSKIMAGKSLLDFNTRIRVECINSNNNYSN